MVESVVITGASGLLGRAVMKEFQSRMPNVHIIGFAFTRAGGSLMRVDLTDFEGTRKVLEDLKPQEATFKLNVDVCQNLASIAAELGSDFLYVSTDSVFDGCQPPYEVDAPTHPLNVYAQSKMEGEVATIRAHPKALVLRVPILYGFVEKNSECSISMLYDNIKNKGESMVIDDYYIKVPTCVQDVARVIFDLMAKKRELGVELSGVFHFSSEEKMTRYEMCRAIAKALGEDIGHLSPNPEPPKSGAAPRPKDSQLSTRRLKEVGISCACEDFGQWMQGNVKL